MDRPDGASSSRMTAPFFVVGTQRSGTTLLYQMLGSHPDLFVVNEFWHLYPHLDGEIRDLEALDRLLASHLELRQLPTTASGEPWQHVDLAFRARLAERGERRWGIKDPRLTYHLDRFAERYPEGRFVFIVRDGRGVVCSYLKRKWNVANAYHGALLWAKEVGIQSEFMRRRVNRCHRLHFESLLDDPEGHLREICDFLGERFSPALLEYYRREPETPIHEGNENITKPIQKAVGDSWRNELSAHELGVIETASGKALVEQGYQLTGARARIGVVRRLYYDLHQWLWTTYWWQRRSGWSGFRNLGRRLTGR